MLVNMCLLLRIVLHDYYHTFSVQQVSVIQCQGKQIFSKKSAAMNEYSNYLDVEQSAANDNIETRQDFTENFNPPRSSFWIYQPATYLSLNTDVFNGNRVIPKPPYLITRLAKSLNAGIDPYFNKEYFQPFEKRSKLITLVALKKHGLMPQKNVNMTEKDNNTVEVAEMQSPYNTPIGD